MLVSCPVSCNQCKNKCDDNNVYCKVEPCEDPDDNSVADSVDDKVQMTKTTFILSRTGLT